MGKFHSLNEIKLDSGFIKAHLHIPALAYRENIVTNTTQRASVV